MPLPSAFPKCLDFDAQMPVWCVTPETNGCIHRFFDTNPISPSGRYLAVFQFPQEERLPEPGEVGWIRVIDLQTGENRVVAETAGWETQLGANLNWGGSDEQLFFNDVDPATWQPFAWKLNPLTGQRQRMEGTVYHASPDGRWLISANLTTMRRTQPGYGVVVPPSVPPVHVGPTDQDGFYLTDTSTGKKRLLVSVRDLVTRANPAVQLPNPEAQELYGFHSKFNPQSNRLMVSLRWYPAGPEPGWDMFRQNHSAVRYAWFTLRLDGSDLHCAVGPEHWEKRGHHATWFPNGEQISMNLAIDRDGMRLVQVNADGTGLQKIVEGVLGSGHPTVTSDGRHILTDSYLHEPMAFGDGTTPLRWIDLPSGQEHTLARLPTKQPSPISALRVDPHPAWDRTERWVTFNAFAGGTRRVYIADFAELMK